MIRRRQFLQLSSLLSLPNFVWSAGTNIYNTEVAIIGSGPAGLSLALRLLEKGVKVIVIESGPFDGYSEHAQTRNKVLDAGYGLPYPLGTATKRMTGGTSSVWGGHCPRLKPDDLKCKSKFGYACDWPISYKELESYYCEAERFLQVFNPASQSDIFDLRDGSTSLAKYLLLNGFKDSVAASVTVNQQGEYEPLRLKQSYIPLLQEYKNFSILNNLTARNIEIDKSGKAKSVLCSDNEGNEIKINCNTVVMCGGAIQSARLLMLVNSQRSSFGLGVDGGQLGANFMDHNAVKTTLFENSESSQNTPPEQGSAAAVKFGQAHVWQWYGRYRKEGVGAYLPLVVQYHELSNAPGQGKNQGRKSDTFRTRKIFQVSILCEQEPLSENRFELSKNEKDEFGDPLPRLWYRSSEFDKRTYQHAAENLNTSLALSLSLHVAMDKNVYLGRHHLMGTTRMAEHDKDGVVDKNLKVFGSENIYALGGSVFPSGGAANPTLTIVALAMRLSGHLLHSRV